MKRHAPHIRSNPEALSVEIKFRGFDPPVTRTLTQAPAAAGELGDYMRRAEEARFILRRAQLLAFISAQPAERYAKLADLIGATSRSSRADLAPRGRTERGGVAAPAQSS